MNNENIQQSMTAFQDFMKHAELEQFSHSAWTVAKQYADQYYEQKAAELEITVDYYIQEFV